MYKRNQKGYVAFITSLIISSYIIGLLISFPTIATDLIRNTFSFEKGNQTRQLALGCMEITLMKMQYDFTYSGEMLTLAEGACDIEVTDLSATNKEIIIEADIGESYTYTMEIEVEIFGRSIGIISIETI